MTRVGFLLKVKEERIEEYMKHHETVCPKCWRRCDRAAGIAIRCS